MHTIFAIMLRLAFRISPFILAWPLVAYASLPQSSSVPGGVALVVLGSATDTGKPQVFLGKQPVLVTRDHDQWYAVVGLPLDMEPGLHELNVMTGQARKTASFMVKSKSYPEQHIKLKDKSKVELSAADLARAEREIAVIKELKRRWSDAPDTDLAFIVPAEGRLASRFGLRRFFNGEARLPHAGLDMAVDIGTPVKASARGKVLAVDDYFFNGKTIFIDHGNGLITMYCHLSRVDVQAGEAVSKGQRVGLSGKTGRATGPHLHWSVILNGAMVDPELFVPARKLGQ